MSTLAQNANPLDDPHVADPGTVRPGRRPRRAFVLPCTSCGKAHWYRAFLPAVSVTRSNGASPPARDHLLIHQHAAGHPRSSLPMSVWMKAR
jgi:hypothetical protein